MLKSLELPAEKRFGDQPVWRYRTDIQGLRGLAVLLVVLYHANDLVPGGFVGVSMWRFFSGYLNSKAGYFFD